MKSSPHTHTHILTYTSYLRHLPPCLPILPYSGWEKVFINHEVKIIANIEVKVNYSLVRAHCFDNIIFLTKPTFLGRYFLLRSFSGYMWKAIYTIINFKKECNGAHI